MPLATGLRTAGEYPSFHLIIGTGTEGLSIPISVATVRSIGLYGTDLAAYRVLQTIDAGTVMLVLTLVIALITIVAAARRRDIIDRDQLVPAKRVA